MRLTREEAKEGSIEKRLTEVEGRVGKGCGQRAVDLGYKTQKKERGNQGWSRVVVGYGIRCCPSSYTPKS